MSERLGSQKIGLQKIGSREVGLPIWRGLLAAALVIVDSLPAAGYGELAFRMGGAVLAFAFDHRVSNDLDLFIDDAQAL